MSVLSHARLGAGEPLVLIHPLGGEWRTWTPVLDALATQRDVIAVDLPGFGDSPSLESPTPPSPKKLALAVADLLDELGLQKAHLAGNSLGGWVALELALMGRGLTVTGLCPAGLWPQPLAPRRSVARQLARLALPVLPLLARSASGRRLALAGTVHRPERVPAGAAAAMVRAYARAPGFDAVNDAMRASRFVGLADISVPVTLAWGEYDRLVVAPPGLPTQMRVALPGCGHLPMWDDPELVTALLLRCSDSATRAVPVDPHASAAARVAGA